MFEAFRFFLFILVVTSSPEIPPAIPTSGIIPCNKLVDYYDNNFIIPADSGNAYVMISARDSNEVAGYMKTHTIKQGFLLKMDWQTGGHKLWVVSQDVKLDSLNCFKSYDYRLFNYP